MGSMLRKVFIGFDAVIMFIMAAYILYFISAPVWMILLLSIIVSVATGIAASQFDTKDLVLKNLLFIVILVLLGYVMYSLFSGSF